MLMLDLFGSIAVGVMSLKFYWSDWLVLILLVCVLPSPACWEEALFPSIKLEHSYCVGAALRGASR